jgi:hypothetical protein
LRRPGSRTQATVPEWLPDVQIHSVEIAFSVTRFRLLETRDGERSHDREESVDTAVTCRRLVRAARIARDLVLDPGAGTPLDFRRIECAAVEMAQIDFRAGAPMVAPDGKPLKTYVFRMAA